MVIAITVIILFDLLSQFVPDPRFEEVKAYVRSGVFGPYNYEKLMGSLEGNEGYGRADYFLVGKDFPSYIECQEKVDEAYRDQKVSNNVVTLLHQTHRCGCAHFCCHIKHQYPTCLS